MTGKLKAENAHNSVSVPSEKKSKFGSVIEVIDETLVESIASSPAQPLVPPSRMLRFPDVTAGICAERKTSTPLIQATYPSS